MKDLTGKRIHKTSLFVQPESKCNVGCDGCYSLKGKLASAEESVDSKFKLAEVIKDINLNKVELIVRNYNASDGNEFFISLEDVENDILLGFCRLRFPSSFLRKEINHDSALIRELHVFGVAAAIGKKSNIQHKGIGKKLLKMAENEAKRYYKKKIVVIAGVGTREYYKKLGYKREGPYMVKKI